MRHPHLSTLLMLIALLGCASIKDKDHDASPASADEEIVFSYNDQLTGFNYEYWIGTERVLATDSIDHCVAHGYRRPAVSGWHPVPQGESLTGVNVWAGYNLGDSNSMTLAGHFEKVGDGDQTRISFETIDTYPAMLLRVLCVRDRPLSPGDPARTLGYCFRPSGQGFYPVCTEYSYESEADHAAVAEICRSFPTPGTMGWGACPDPGSDYGEGQSVRSDISVPGTRKLISSLRRVWSRGQ